MTKLVIPLFVLLSLFLGSKVFASDKVFLIGVEDVNYAPLFSFSAERELEQCFTRELLTSFFNHHQLKFKFVALPIKRFDKWFIEQGIDFKFPDNMRWRESKRDKLNITFSAPVIELVAGTYVLKKNESLPKHQVTSLSTITGFHPTLWLDEIGAGQVTLIEEGAPVGVVKHLLLGNADATNIDKNVIRRELKKLKSNEQIVLAKNIPHQTYYYHFSSIKYPEIIGLFNRFLSENEGYIRTLKQKYGITE